MKELILLTHEPLPELGRVKKPLVGTLIMFGESMPFGSL